MATAADPQRFAPRRRNRLAGLLPLLLGLGCQAYRPLDLADDEPPHLAGSANELVRRAAALHNPLLRSTAIDPSDGYSPEELAVVAVVCNPTLVAARGRAVTAVAQANAATLLPNPVLAFTVDVPLGANTAGEVTGYGLNLEWEITSLLAHGAKRAAATQIAEQNRLDVAWQEWQIAEAARQAAYDVLGLRVQLTAARTLARRLDDIAASTRRALDRRDVTATDASAATAAAGEAHITVAAAERDLADAELALRRALGVPPDESVPLSDRPLTTHADVPDASTLADGLGVHRIDLVALRSGYASQGATVRAAVLGQFPKISLGLSHTRDTGDFHTLGPALTVDLPVFDRNQGVIAVETATRRQLFDEYHARLFEARSDVACGVAAVRAIDKQARVVGQQVDTLQALVTSDERALNTGELDVTTYYTAAVSLAQRQADLGKLRQELMRSLIALELAAGVYLPVTP